MKKLRMIVTSVVVLAIVGSALAFNTKRQTPFCVVVKGLGDPTECTTYTTGTTLKRVFAGGTMYKYFPNWDGDGPACAASGNANCTGQARLDID